MSPKSTKKSEKIPVLWVLSTHWDREWYQSFQGYRYRLVRLLDELFETMQRDPRFSHYQMDGQSIPIEDYLEIRPDREELIRELASSGRLLIGPWYVLPDEFLVSGEAQVRNLQMGLEIAERFGPPSLAGFVCDIFGHHSQLPQIFKGFGIDVAYVWRGINEQDVGSMFRWQAADGSEVLAYRFGPSCGYGDLALQLRNLLDLNTGFDLDEVAKATPDYIQSLADRAPQGMPVLVFDGLDHMEIEPRTPEWMERVQQDPRAVDWELRMGTLEDFTREFIGRQSRIKKTIKGELRDVGREFGKGHSGFDGQWLIPGVLSSRIQQKQQNARCQALLTQWAEPFSLFASGYGLPYPADFLRVAWRYLLRNHPHDSICGCSIDQVHKDVNYRFDQSEGIALELRKAALEHLTDRVAAAYEEKAEKPHTVLLLVNPTNEAIDEPVDFTVSLPEDTPQFSEFFHFENKPGFWLTDAEGQRLPYQRVAQRMNRTSFRRPLRKIPIKYAHHEVDVTARVKIPAYGFTTLGVWPVDAPTRHETSRMTTGLGSAENAFLAIDIDASGRLNIRDKRGGKNYEGLLELENRADIGDGWYHGVAVNDEIFTSKAAAASVSCVADGPEKVTFRVELSWSLTAAFDFKEMRRAAERRIFKVNHEITLRAGAERVEVRTIVENDITDHRLRVLFPTGAKAESYLADSPFDVVSRPIALNPEHMQWRELQVETAAQQSWTAVAGGGWGLAVVSQGLPESAVLDVPERPIALTLLRAFRKTVFTDGEPGGQIQGRHEFNYWIVPLRGEPDHVALCRLGQRLNGGIVQHESPIPRLVPQEDPLKIVDKKKAKLLPAATSFLQVGGKVVVTAVRQTKDGSAVIRLFNPTDKQAASSVRWNQPIAKAWTCNLRDEPMEGLDVKQGGVKLNVPPRKIVTVMTKLK